MPGCHYSCEYDENDGCRVVKTRYTALSNKPTGPVGDCCVGGWVQPLADNTIIHLSELETGGVRLLGHQITSLPEQRRVNIDEYFEDLGMFRCRINLMLSKFLK